MAADARRGWLLFCALVVAVRAPALILFPRLVAEEASVYLAYAQSHGVLRSLLLVPTSAFPAGYLNLPANLAATLSAHGFPLELAPAVATALAFSLQLLPFALILWGRSRFWNTPFRRALCCLVVLFAPAIRPPIWLSVVNSQVFCGLAALILLCEDLRGAGRRRIWAYRLVLCFCGLSGVYTAFLALPFLVRAYQERRRESAIQSFIVTGAAFLQLAAYVATTWIYEIAPDRFGAIDWGAAASFVFLYHLAQPILSGHLVGDALAPERWPYLGTVSLLGLIGFFWWLTRRRRDPLYGLLPLSFLLISGATTVLAYGLPRRRYAVLSGLVVLLALLAASWSEAGPGRRRPARRMLVCRVLVCRVLVGVALAIGVATYWLEAPVLWRGEPVSYFGKTEGRPDWPREVRAWRRDSRRPLRVWPYTPTTSWSTHLAGRDDFRDIRNALAALDGFHLVASRRASELRVPIDGLPADFKILLRATSTHGPSRTRLEVLLLDAELAPVAAGPVFGFRPGEPFTAHFTPPELIPEPGRDLVETRYLTIRASSRNPEPRPGRDRFEAVVAVERVEVAPRIEGLLDGVLPARSFPERLYHASPARPLAHEATPVLALESLARDRDLLYTAEDAARARQRWQRGPRGLELEASGSSPGRAYREPAPYLGAALPFAAAAGPDGQVVFNLVLYLGMSALAWRQRRQEGLGGRLFVTGSFLGAAGLGFVFLPQSQVFEMFCLFVPVSLWIHGRLEAPLASCLSGALLGTAAVQEPAWLLIAAVVAADLALRRRWRAAAVTALTIALCAAAWVALPRWLPRGGGSPSPTAVEEPSGGPIVEEGAGAAAFVRSSWRLYTAGNGLVLGYPFVILALVALVLSPLAPPKGTVSEAVGQKSGPHSLTARDEGDRPRLLLFAALVALTGWIAWQGAEAARQSPLGSPHFAVLFPLFSLLPVPAPSWRASIVAGAGAVLFTLGIVSSVWTP